jgi:CspA family cold shock protein
MSFIERIRSIFSSSSNSNTLAQKGTIKFFNRRKGYGFILPEGEDKEIFVHISALKSKVSKGDRVLFLTEKDERGLKAKDVRLLKA